MQHVKRWANQHTAAHSIGPNAFLQALRFLMPHDLHPGQSNPPVNAAFSAKEPHQRTTQAAQVDWWRIATTALIQRGRAMRDRRFCVGRLLTFPMHHETVSIGSDTDMPVANVERGALASFDLVDETTRENLVFAFHRMFNKANEIKRMTRSGRLTGRLK